MNDRQNGLSPMTENLKRRSVQHGALRSGNARQSSTRNAVEWWRLFTLIVPGCTTHRPFILSQTDPLSADDDLYYLLPETGIHGIVVLLRPGVGLRHVSDGQVSGMPGVPRSQSAGDDAFAA